MQAASSAATLDGAHAHAHGHAHAPSRPQLDAKTGPVTAIVFIALLGLGLAFSAWNLVADVSDAGPVATTYLPYLLLGVALLIALGFEFVNGFHDTANAVATVIYTHSLPPNFAVVWSGFFNFLGVLTSSGAVAFGIISLPAGGADPAGRLQRRLRHGVRAADRRHRVEPGHLVAGAAGLVLAHPDRLHHRCRHRQRADARPRRHQWR